MDSPPPKPWRAQRHTWESTPGICPSLVKSIGMTDPQLLQQLLNQAADGDDIHEWDVSEYLEDHHIPIHSHSLQYLITLAFNNGWRPEPSSSHSSKVTPNACLQI